MLEVHDLTMTLGTVSAHHPACAGTPRAHGGPALAWAGWGEGRRAARPRH